MGYRLVSLVATNKMSVVSITTVLCIVCACSGCQGVSSICVNLTGPPSEPDITYNDSSLCISAYSHEEFQAVNFTVEITDIIGVPIDLAGTYNTLGPLCLNFSFDPVPDLCFPFRVSVSSTNAIGTNNSSKILHPGNVQWLAQTR